MWVERFKNKYFLFYGSKLLGVHFTYMTMSPQSFNLLCADHVKQVEVYGNQP